MMAAMDSRNDGDERTQVKFLELVDTLELLGFKVAKTLGAVEQQNTYQNQRELTMNPRAVHGNSSNWPIYIERLNYETTTFQDNDRRLLESASEDRTSETKTSLQDGRSNNNMRFIPANFARGVLILRY